MLLLWQFLVGVWFPPVSKPPGSTNIVATATNNIGTNAVAAPSPAPAPTVTTTTTSQTIVVATNLAEQLEMLETADAIYSFTSRGGGIKHVQLKHYLETVGCDRTTSTNQFATLNDHARLPVLAMAAGDAFGDNDFKLTRASSSSITAEKVLPSGLRVVKQFDLGSNYQITARVRIENTSGQPVVLPPQQASIGTATPMGPRDDMTLMGVFFFNGEKAEHIEQSWFDGGGGCFKKTVRPLYGPVTNRMVWAAVHNQFFTIAVV
ncbi:MAG TPA: YidC/Oxa1 family insertase periplasmic-domain containing protein, partial [Candidatus Limnocylindria bacterium]|nr:YidC/Oxa1 family insertase periplasmic-domain containing protein [Candidatus Limnocylindria bacterium]